MIVTVPARAAAGLQVGAAVDRERRGVGDARRVGARVGQQLRRAGCSGLLVGGGSADEDRAARARVRELPDRALVCSTLDAGRVARAVLVGVEQDPLDALGAGREARADRVRGVAVVERQVALGSQLRAVVAGTDGGLDAVADLVAAREGVAVARRGGRDLEAVQAEAAVAREGRRHRDVGNRRRVRRRTGDPGHHERRQHGDEPGECQACRAQRAPTGAVRISGRRSHATSPAAALPGRRSRKRPPRPRERGAEEDTARLGRRAILPQSAEIPSFLRNLLATIYLLPAISAGSFRSL